MNRQKKQVCAFLVFFCTILISSSLVIAQPLRSNRLAEKILNTCEVKGGLIVHIGCGDGKLTAALRANERYIVQGLDSDVKNVEQARKFIQSLGVYGAV